MQSVWLHRFTILLAVVTLFLVVAGASVTSNDAGLSVPDWPLSYGKLMPNMTGGVFYEHGHRMVGATVGFLTIILAVWVSTTDDRVWMKRLGWIALAGVIFQGVLGGLTVLYKLPKPISITHACTAPLFFSLMVAFTQFTSPRWRAGPEPVEESGRPSLRFLAVLVPVVVLAQIALGAAYRHQAFGLAPHLVGALVVTIVVMMAATLALQQFPKHRMVHNAAMAMLLVTLVQVFLGILAYASRVFGTASDQLMGFMVIATVLHVAAGALTLASSVVFAIHVRRNVRPPHHAGEAVSVTS